jgi:hypothetical protein
MESNGETMTRIEMKYTRVHHGDITFCDICKSQSTGSYSHCGICDRDVCDKCWSKELRTTEINDRLYLIPCPTCRNLPEVQKYITELEYAHTEEKAAREKIWAIERKWGEASRKSNPKPLIKDLRKKIKVKQ